jgi:transcriptional regulator of acetoin/glycerol metabolism
MGKELAARALYAHSLGANRRFVPVDSTAIGETVIGSELFGHVKGACTGAHLLVPGLIRSADQAARCRMQSANCQRPSKASCCGPFSRGVYVHSS